MGRLPQRVDELVASDTNNKRDIFVHRSQLTERVSVSTGGAEANDHCWAPAISSGRPVRPLLQHGDEPRRE
jgi:hypothetical protein